MDAIELRAALGPLLSASTLQDLDQGAEALCSSKSRRGGWRRRAKASKRSSAAFARKPRP